MSDFVAKKMPFLVVIGLVHVALLFQRMYFKSEIGQALAPSFGKERSGVSL